MGSLCILALFAASAAYAGPADIVPRGDISYDLLGSLASSGRLAGTTLRDFLRGDRLYTRTEMAEFVRRARRDLGDKPAARDAVAIRALESEFAPELGSGMDLPLARAARLTGDIKLRALTDPAAGDAIARGSLTLPIASSGYAALSLGNWRDEWYDKHAPLHSYPLIETAYARVNGRVLDVSVGSQPLRWGPGYVGGILISDQAPSIPQVRVEKTFRFGGSLRRMGPLHFEQFDGQFFESDDPNAVPDARGSRRYLLGRRIETAGSGPWSFGIAESLKTTRLPSPIFANILPFYLYQNEWTESSRRKFLSGIVSGALPDTFWKNYVADVNMSYRTDSRGTTLYGDFLLDDVKAPSGISMEGPTTQKLGGLLGVYVSDLAGLHRRIGGRLEFATIDPGAYTNTSHPVSWTDEGIALGYPTGPNANVVFGRLDFAATDKLRLAAEGMTRRRKGEDFVGFGPTPNTDRLGLYATYSLRRNAFLGARFEHQHSSDGTNRNRAELNVGAGF